MHISNGWTLFCFLSSFLHSHFRTHLITISFFFFCNSPICKCLDILWYHNSKFIKSDNNIKIDINFDELKSTCTILCASKEHEGIYQCKAINDVCEKETRAKLELAMSGTATKTTETNSSTKTVAQKPVKRKTKRQVKATAASKVTSTKEKEEIDTKTTTTQALSVLEYQPVSNQVVVEIPEEIKQDSSKSISTVEVITTARHVTESEDVEILEETEEIHVKIYKEIMSAEELENFKVTDEVNAILDVIQADQFGAGQLPLRELATIGYLLKKGISYNEISQMYNASFFPALKIPESQSALVQLVERQGHEDLIAEVLNTETAEDEAMLASTVGFRAFMRMLEKCQLSIEEMIKDFKFEDFISQEWKYKEIKEHEFIDIRESRTSIVRTENKISTGNETDLLHSGIEQ